MTWKFVAGDQYSRQQLEDFRVFFYQDFLRAQADYDKYQTYAKYGLPNFRGDQLRRKMGIEEAQRNLIIVNQAISEL